MINNICFFHWCKGSDYFWNHQIKSRFILNKMYFYCFLPSLSTNFTNFTNFFVFVTWWTGWTWWLPQCIVWLNLVHLVIIFFSCVFCCLLNRRQRRQTRKLYMIVAVAISYFCAFCVFLWLILVAHSGARTWCHALPWWAVCCRYPHGPQKPKTKIL